MNRMRGPWGVGYVGIRSGAPRTALWLIVALTSVGRAGPQQARDANPSAAAGAGASSSDPGFQVGVARRDITPTRPVPMWGYGARHDQLSRGVIRPLYAKALVVQAGESRLAIVGMDLGRGPTPAMMERIRRAVTPRGITHVLISGSHTHHGPVIELTDQPGFGRGKFDAAVAYANSLPDRIVEAILEADSNRRPARFSFAHRDLALNRNRHSKRPLRPTDPRLTVLRFDLADGAPLALLVHYTAHPVMTPAKVLEFSPDYPGFLQDRVEQEWKAACLFIQGAAGDQSANPPERRRDPKAYGELLAQHALELARSTNPAAPPHPSLAGTTDHFEFSTRVNFRSPITALLYSRSFFPELIRNSIREFEAGMRPEVTTVLLNRELAIVGVPGEPFCQHAVRLRERAYLPCVLLFGYCNGHLLYIPTIEAASEGGYGADPPVSPIALGAGEAMMNQALINIYRMLGKFAPASEPAARIPADGQAPARTPESSAARSK